MDTATADVLQAQAAVHQHQPVGGLDEQHVADHVRLVEEAATFIVAAGIAAALVSAEELADLVADRARRAETT